MRKVEFDRPFRGIVAAGLVAATTMFAFAPSTQARVTKIVIDDTQPLTAAGQTIPFRQVSGRAFGELNSEVSGNHIIQDIGLGKDPDGNPFPSIDGEDRRAAGWPTRRGRRRSR